jgi:Zn-finger nucleic acid-binding protein
MICPKCKSYLSRKIIRTCEVHCCMECDGVWVGKETFCRLGNIMSFDLPPVKNKKYKLFKPRDIKKSGEQIIPRICPQCSVGMKQFNYAYDSNIFLDKCPKCGGIWADTGEMMQVAKYLKPDMDERIIAGAIAENPYMKQFENDEGKILHALDTVVSVGWILGWL